MSLIGFCPPVDFQGDAKTCYSKAAKHAFETIKRKDHGDTGVYSSQYIHAMAHRVGKTSPYDATTAEHIIAGMRIHGVCLDEHYKYSIENLYDDVEAPSPIAELNAYQNRIFDERKLNTLKEIQECLDGGYPAIFHYKQYTSHATEQVEASGILNLPLPGDFLLPNHAGCAVGYDDQFIIFANSFGEHWGRNGYGKLPIAFIARGLAGYFWTFKC